VLLKKRVPAIEKRNSEQQRFVENANNVVV